MDIETIDQNYQQLQDQGQQTARALSELAGKLQRAAEAGDMNAREWLLDLKEVALEIRTEQSQVGALLQSLHGFVANQLQNQQQPYDRVPPQQSPYPPQQPQYQQPQYQQPQYQQQYQQQPYGQQGYQGQGGGMLSRFMGSGFGQAVEMGAGFAIGDDLINDLFR
jgi:hypothetical protein